MLSHGVNLRNYRPETRNKKPETLPTPMELWNLGTSEPSKPPKPSKPSKPFELTTHYSSLSPLPYYLLSIICRACAAHSIICYLLSIICQSALPIGYSGTFPRYMTWLTNVWPFVTSAYLLSVT